MYKYSLNEGQIILYLEKQNCKYNNYYYKYYSTNTYKNEIPNHNYFYYTIIITNIIHNI